MRKNCIAYSVLFIIWLAGDVLASDSAITGKLPRVPPLEPSEALTSFEILPGFRLEQVASEPLVRDPVAAAFDESGRLYVVEMCDYSEQDKDFLGNVRLLEDSDGDGKFDKSILFADRLSWPTAIICFNGGVFVGAPPHIYYLKDTDGDFRADERKVVFTGFGRSNVQGMLNSFCWGLDCRVYGSASANGGEITCPQHPDRRAIDCNGRDFSFDPQTLAFRTESGGAQHGMTFDDWGRRFVCSNGDHLQLVMYDDRYAGRNRVAPLPPARLRIASDGPQAEVFRISPVEPWRILRTEWRLSGKAKGAIEGGGRAAGYFTSATGVTVYRGDAFPPEFRNQVFIADVGSNIVHRKLLEPDGVSLIGKRIDKGSEFLASKDNWFRPVQFANAPDGTLYILDMYREVIEHPWSIPSEIKAHLDLTSGRDRGRIYRVVPAGYKQQTLPRLGEASAADLVKLLEHRNGWHRDTASRLLVERKSRAVIPELTKLATSSNLPEARIQSMYLLQSLDGLSDETVLACLDDSHPRVREHAIRLAEKKLTQVQVQSKIVKRLTQLANDKDINVRYQLAFTLASVPIDDRISALATILSRDLGNRWIESAACSSLDQSAGQLLVQLTKQDSIVTTTAGRALLTKISKQIASGTNEDDLKLAEECLASVESSHPSAASAIIRGLASSGKNRREALSPKLSGFLARTLEASRLSAIDDAAPLANRIDAVHMLCLGSFDDASPVLAELLASAAPNLLRVAAIETLGQFNRGEVADILLHAWPLMTPDLRAVTSRVLFSRPSWILTVFRAVEEGTFQLADIDPGRLRLLEKHRSDTVRRQAKRLLSKLQLGKRSHVVTQYREALRSLSGYPDRGKEIFRAQCAACHQLGNIGHPIGPNLASFAQKGADALLLNVLDPNREVNPQYVVYEIATLDGLTTTGLLIGDNDNSITVLREENKTQTILRSDIDVEAGGIRNTGQSLMPEGLEKVIDYQAMADLIAYLQSIQADDAATAK